MLIYPVIIFAYNRPIHLNSLLESLQRNDFSNETEVFLFIDKCGDEKIHSLLLEIANYNWNFKSINLTVHEKNIGLKNNILFGLNTIFENYEAAIVLEDDLILDKYFLEYMNSSLNKYKDKKTVFHVNGWSYPQIFPRQKSNFIGSLATPWGWGTWKDRWENFDINFQNSDLIVNESTKNLKKFNFYNLVKFSGQLNANITGKISTLDIFWYQYIFFKNGLTIFPKFSLVSNSGFDGSGMHCGISNKYEYKLKNRPLGLFNESLRKDWINEISTFYFYFNLKVKDFFSYHLSKFGYSQSN